MRRSSQALRWLKALKVIIDPNTLSLQYEHPTNERCFLTAEVANDHHIHHVDDDDNYKDPLLIVDDDNDDDVYHDDHHGTGDDQDGDSTNASNFCILVSSFNPFNLLIYYSYFLPIWF